MSILYHYTNLRTLCAIVDGMRKGNMFLRAGNAKNMNDPNDCYYFISLLGQLINADKNDIAHLFEEKSKYDNPYLISLSSHKDDLHMWNCYGDDGHGIALGIEGLSNCIENFYNKNHISSRLYECIYYTIEDIQNDHRLANITLAELTKSFWEDMSNIANIIKHPCYRYEKEYRIVIKHGEKELTINNIYREDEDAFYVPIPLSCVKEIIVGPNANLDSIQKIFSQYFPDTKFQKSTIPYRSHE